MRQLGTFPGDFPSILMPMCDACNHTFGERFESPTAPIMKPMILGGDTELSPADQAVVASWIVKSALLFALLHSTDETIAGTFRRNLIYMRDHGEISVPALVRVGTMPPLEANEPPHGGLHASGDLPFAALYNVSTLGWVVWEVAIAEENVMLSFVQSLPKAPSLIEFWPAPAPSISWPAQVSCNQADVRMLRQAWRVQHWPPPDDAPIVGPGIAIDESTYNAD
jgi:hypothetical protein